MKRKFNCRTFSAALILFATTFLATTMVVLWSWNSLAEVFHGPHLEFRQSAAIVAISIMLHAIFRTGRQSRLHARACRHGVIETST
jgi:hypothetical protein